MAYRNEEDLFNDDAFDFVVRFEGKAIKHLNNQNNGTFDDIRKWVGENQYQCVFSKKNEDEHKLLISIENENKNIELTLKWQPKTFDYKAVINKKSKKIIREYEKIEINKYHFREDVNLIFIDFNESNFPSREQKELFDRISKLEISPKSNIENQQEIWEKWIEAQEIILDKNSQPIDVAGYDQPIDVSPIRKQFRTKLKQKGNPEYLALQEALKEEPFKIDEEFFPDGTIYLKLNDIHNGIDRVIEKKFSGTFERNINVGCILKIKPYLFADYIRKSLNNKYKVAQNSNNRTIYVTIQKPAQRTEIIEELFSENFKLNSYIGIFQIDWDKNVTLDKKFIKDNNLTFDKKEKGKIFLPEPNQNTFRKKERDLDKLHTFYKQLISLFGKENIKTEILLEFHTNNEEIVFETDFSEDFWSNLKREIYSLDFDADASQAEKTISFDFTNEQDLRHRFNSIMNLNSKFNLVKSPLDQDFNFKVKTDLIAKKSKKEEFGDKLKSLAGVEFQLELETENSKRKKFVPIGNLTSRNSDYNNLVFNLPYKWKDEKRQTNIFLKFIEDEPRIDRVFPNLRGDKAKISWLSEAMNKVNNPQEGLDTKPVNDKLREFVFDSSRATEVYRDLSEDTEDWNELKKHELLTLNNSQRRAILSALHSTDLALLQGPPGTGKTTVIAEMIWQMIRTNQEQKVLLTSETNLAVDNALEKLLNKEHTLVKPIRFGRASKFEEEGKKYSFERIMKWIDENTKVDDLYENEANAEDEEIQPDDLNNNAVQLWMRRIASNSQQTNPKYSDVMKDWAFEMAQPSKEMKQLYKDKYFKYCNVVGSTSSSAGSPNFGADYQRIFNDTKFIKTKHGEVEIEKFAKKVKNIIKRHKSDFGGWYAGVNVFDKIKNIEFDTVITDEASKATPPELLLPMCYGKKNVIIGDHRQLPPMLHDKSFKEVLETLDTKEAKELAEEIDKDFVETSQFERLITHPDVSPTIKSTFNEQYRMHPKINNVIKQFYLDEGGLEPGKPIVENADDINLNNPFSRHHGFILKGFIKPDIHTIWINVDEPEEKSGTSRVNTTEAEAVGLVLKMLKQSDGFSEYMSHWDSLKDENKRKEEKEVGLISFYGHQVGLLKEIAKYSQSKLDIPVRLNTVDKFQGMERNIIIVSTVRSNQVIDNGVTKPNRDIGFAKSPQRLNVALSRAKRLLIVVGNKDFFSQYQNKNGERIYENVIEIIKNEGTVIDFNELKNKYGHDK